MAIIVLDPGHGGNDPGAVYNNYREKDFNLELALAVKTHLVNNYAAAVYLTRDTDITVNLMARTGFVNNLGADVFISLHINAGGGTGFESFIFTGAPLNTQNIQRTIHSAVAGFYQSLGFPDRGMKRANFAVLRNTGMPAVLLENLFIDNPKDLEQLLKPGFAYQLGPRIGLGIARALDLPAGSSPPSPEASPPQPPQVNNWDPQAEIERLRQDGLVANEYSPSDPVNWGQFATVLNMLRNSLGG